MAELRIVGTAHVSKESVDEVEAAFAEFNPDVVAVELDPGRYAALKKKMAEPTVSEVLQSGNFTQLLIQWTLSYLQRKIGMDVGVEPGAEMKAAIAKAEEGHKRIALIDRDIRITLSRFWKTMSLWEKIKMFYALSASIVGVEGEEIDIESLKRDDVIAFAMEEFRKFSPNGARALIDERDAFLAHQLLALNAGEGRVLAVIGAGHVKGVRGYMENPETLPPIADLTKDVKTPPWGMIFGVAVTALFALMIVAIAFSGVGWDVLLWALIYWVLVHGILTAVFTLAAGGHPLSALTGFAVSWFTALNPLIAAGWFSAIVEAKIRKPSPADVRRIFEAESFSDMWKIPLFKVVLVAALANVGSTLGTVLYFIVIFPWLGIDPTVVIGQGFSNMYQAFLSLF
ncbi:MAG TPA: TraB/GumN family protein [Methanoregulaceae archaeon]|nr:TraB/GumN family protein [Methanoregulaceae archaeon]